MLSDKPHILQLAALLHAHGVEDVVVCPGSRNAPIVHTLAACGLFHCHPITDERSAGFFAIGLSLATGRPAAVCVTSGSALLNLHPAVAEAYYQHVPLIVVSADRPAAWIGQQDGQTLPQPNALGQLVRFRACLPEVHTTEDEWHANRLINEAMLACRRGEGGPVHINLPISEPLYSFGCKELPRVRVIRHIVHPQACDLLPLLGESRRRWLIIGQCHTPIEPALLERLSRHFTIWGEQLSGVAGLPCVSIPTDEWMTNLQADDRQHPDLVITLGGHLVSKGLKQLLRQHRPAQHWHVSRDGAVVDTFCCQTLAVEADSGTFLSALDDAYFDPKIPVDRPKNTRRPEKKYPSSPAMQLVADTLNTFASEHANAPVLHLANSTTVRAAEYVHFHPSISVQCNRGVNGIEGSLSTAVGFATATPKRLNVVIIGDLSFFYDQNALWNTRLPQNLRILLINNSGGGIFNCLPVPQQPESHACICGTHHTETEALCRHYGLHFASATTIEQLRQLVPLWLKAEGSSLLEYIHDI